MASEENDKQKIKMIPIRFEISEGGIAVINRIAEALRGKSHADVWRISIALLDFLIEQAKKGGRIAIIQENGEVKELNKDYEY